MKWNMGALKDGIGTGREVLKASVTTIEAKALPSVYTFGFLAKRTNGAIGPPTAFDIYPRRFLVREHLKNLISTNSCIFHNALRHLVESIYEMSGRCYNLPTRRY